MMPLATSDSASIWIGGCLAIAGTALGLLGSLAAGWLERKNQRHKLLRERYEEFAQCIAATLPWFARLGVCRNLEEVRSCQPPPESRRMILLALVYFPEFKGATGDYHNGLIEHYGFAVDSCGDPLAGLGTVGAIMAKRTADGLLKPADYTKRRQILDNLIEKHADKYTKS